MLKINNITYRIGGRSLLDEASFSLPQGHHGALVGRNGCGKSTLFRLILGQAEAEGGSVHLSRGSKIATVAQEVPSGTQCVLDFVMDADDERASLLKEADTTTDPHRLGEIHERLFDIDAYTAEARASKILLGLGFSEERQMAEISSFSGGWRMRIALAAALFQRPDLLLLDEPTNHLDLEAAVWLESYLKTYPYTFLLISHDRAFMNAVVDRVFHIHKSKITSYTGDYDTFERTRKEQLAFADAFNKKLEGQRKHMQAFVDRFKAKASKARQAQSRMKAIEKLEPMSLLLDDPSLTLKFPAPPPLSPPYISLDKVSVGYNDTPLLRNLGATIGPDDRIALLGANGNGKSTFAKLLSGRLDPLSGDLYRAGKLSIGFFHQHQMEELTAGWSSYDHLKELLPLKTPVQVRAQLGQFGFSGEKADLSVEKLSGGEKARLVMALMSAQHPQILIFDEPTNHLDIEMRESLMMAINDFKGAVIIISHDWHLLRHTVDRLWVVGDGTVTPFDGDLDDYRCAVLGIKSKAPKDKQVSNKGSKGKKGK